MQRLSLRYYSYRQYNDVVDWQVGFDNFTYQVIGYTQLKGHRPRPDRSL